MLRYLPFLIVLALWVWAFVDCLITPEEEVRHLPKVVWILVILFLGEVLVGPIAWLVAGRARVGAARRRAPWPSDADGRPEDGRPQRRVLAPDDDPEFLASLGKHNAAHEDMLKQWESDLRRREEELRRRADRADEADGGRGAED
ncbi:PLD nuclease N-terminal domain-containing protein [Streptacidiphilus sp. ASG 303]|uniref:PLD nuclease N-terminal domain-containing protein n=1 Tax=Streptacidiphilus sp. ASG 303 TaxID=2896847 RepID=UPI001E57021F|nr:PLD nuclease N-terminal domain-containing protein [Streptacidiphilus sp. ASG 303]MCD0485295.1 PLD nuclease N-terminal domain-containing protein [Streptacidiphilus sp. ASG 303]